MNTKEAASRKRGRSWPLLLSCLLLILAVGLVSYYIWVPSRGEFHSDTADTLMWAQASYNAKGLIDPDFNYACFLPFGGHLLMVPFVAIFGVTLNASLWGMFLFALLLTASLLFLLRSVPLSWTASNLGTGLMLIAFCISQKTREMFYGHIIYYSLGLFLAFWGLGMVFRGLRKIERARTWKQALPYGLLIFLWFMLSATNQLEIVSIFCVPAIGAIVLERLFFFEKTSQREKLASGAVLGSAALGTALGYVLGGILVKGKTASYATAYSSFSDPKLWWENLSHFFPHWTSLIGMNVTDEMPFSSPEGFLGLLYLALAAVLLVCPIVLTCLYPRIKQRGGRILIWFHWLVTGLIMVGFICGKLSQSNWRLIPIMCTSLLLTVYLAVLLLAATPWKRLAAIPLAALLLGAGLAAGQVVQLPRDVHEGYNADIYEIAEFLKENDLSYGYAEFFKAGAITVLSDSKAKTHTVVINGDGVHPYHFQNYSSCYDEQEGQENYFLLLNNSDYEQLLTYQTQYIDMCDDEYEIGEDYHVLVYDFPPLAENME